MEGGGEVHHFIMIYAKCIDILRLHDELSPDPLTTRMMLTYYSVIEHEISNLGFDIKLCTEDVRNMPGVVIAKLIRDVLKDLVRDALSGIEANKEAFLSIHTTGKHFIITVK